MNQKNFKNSKNQIYNNLTRKFIFLCKKFGIEGEFKYYKIFNDGHINSTFLVVFEEDDKEKKYVLQKINTYVFKNPKHVMENIFNVTNHIKEKLKSKGENHRRKVLKFYKTDKNLYTTDENNDCWRLYRFIDKSVTFNNTENLEILEETGKAFGEFQQHLNDFPAEKLNIIIPHFHNTISRYQDFKNSIKEDNFNRVDDIKEETENFLKLEKIATKMYKLQKQGLLHLRVTHNDTKCNNVLFDEKTNKHLSVIDLDTVMPGLIGFDFGDAIRFCANSANEDETDLSQVYLDMEKYKAFTKGFLDEVASSLTETEQETLTLGAITMTIECGLRFLTDYLNGDVYFKTNYCNHNLDRARCQLTLAEDMIEKHQAMKDFINQYLKTKEPKQ